LKLPFEKSGVKKVSDAMIALVLRSHCDFETCEAHTKFEWYAKEMENNLSKQMSEAALVMSCQLMSCKCVRTFICTTNKPFTMKDHG